MTDQCEAENLKILRVAQQVYPKALGGGAYHVHALSRDQGLRGHNVEVVTVSDDSRGYRDDHYDVTAYPCTVELFKNQFSADVLKSLIDLGKYDVVHAHSHLRATTNFCALSRCINDTPLLITNHGSHSQSVPYWFSEVYNRTVGRFTMNRSDVVFCYTAEEKRQLREFGISTDIEIVHNGIDHEMFRPQTDSDPRIESSGPAILFVGRLCEGKRPQDALIAFETVKRTYPDAELFLCGDGPLRTDLTDLAERLGCRKSVHFLGHIEYNAMPSIYSAADVLVLPSRTEGFPRVVLEALSAETPVVVSHLEQIASLVQQVGKTAPVGDAEAFATRVLSLLRDQEELKRLGESGREIVKERFSWSETVEDVTTATRKKVRNKRENDAV
ncbi:glycosyltransferase family 4 protein [Halostella sp. PRR32]|uniref:glycosyltransferase family 4 protein n=1 Tax=Halostella sp. PRR32 TaxID=3098147 RepID=UPI002B1DE4C2|nr:glycosyltransferase family 4 protein [Halostella sp. PRR32]